MTNTNNIKNENYSGCFGWGSVNINNNAFGWEARKALLWYSQNVSKYSSLEGMSPRIHNILFNCEALLWLSRFKQKDFPKNKLCPQGAKIGYNWKEGEINWEDYISKVNLLSGSVYALIFLNGDCEEGK